MNTDRKRRKINSREQRARARQARRDLESVTIHLDMLLYGLESAEASVVPVVSLARGFNVPWLYHVFAQNHLIVTLFLVDRRRARMGGAIFRILSRINLASWLDPIREILDTRIGETTFGDFLRHNRNRLMVHGDLNFGGLPKEAQALVRSSRKVERFNELMAEFVGQVRVLRHRVRRELESGVR